MEIFIGQTSLVLKPFHAPRNSYFPLEIGNKFYYNASYFPDKGSYRIIKTIVDTLTDGKRKIKVEKYFKDSISISYEYWFYDNAKFYTGTNPNHIGEPVFDGFLLKDSCIYLFPTTMCFEIRDSIFFSQQRYCQIYKKYILTHIESYELDFVTAENVGIYSQSTIRSNYKPAIDALTLTGYVRNGEATGDTTLLDADNITNLIQPANNSSEIFNPAVFKWNKVKDAISYIIQVFGYLDFPIGKVSYDKTITDTSINLSLKNNTTYYWRIETKDKDGREYWSLIWNFKTINPLVISSLKYPSDNLKDVDQPVTFKWSFALRATYYRLQISTDSLFSDLIYDDSTIKDTLKSINSLISSTKYYWRVQTIIPGGETHWSQTWSFTTSSAEVISSLLLPLNNSVEIPRTIELKWKKDPFAVSYELQISTDSLFNQISFDFQNLQDTSLTIDSLKYSCKYYWHIKTVSSKGEYLSPVWNFTTESFPTEFKLYQNYPNPFNPNTKIKYDLPKAGRVTLKIYDLLGREVTTLVNEEKPAGKYEIKFKRKNFPSGVYFYKLQTDDYSSVKKMILVK